MFVKSIIITDEAGHPLAAGSGPSLLKSFNAHGQPTQKLGAARIVVRTEDGGVVGANDLETLAKSLPVFGRKPV